MKSAFIGILLCLAAVFPAFASTPYSHPDEATGQQINPASGAVDYIRFAIIRGAPRKNQASSCVGAAGMLYHKVMRADGSSPYIDELRTCVAAQAVPDWTTCTQGVAYQRTRGSTDAEILSADMAVANGGKIAVGWIEASGTAPSVTIKYFVRVSSDNGATWWPVTQVASYQTDSFAVPYDVDLAANDAGDIGMLVYFDQSASSSAQTLNGQPTTDWLSMLKFTWSGSTWNYSVLNNASPPDVSPMQGTQLFDLVGGGGDGMFHALYSQNRDLKVSTIYTYGAFVRTLVASTDSMGVLPRGTKSYYGIAALTQNAIYNVSHSNAAPALKANISNFFYMSGNEFSNWLVLQSAIQPGIFDIAIHTVSPVGVVSAPIYPVNDPLGLPRCQDNITNVGAQCADITHAITIDAQPNVGELGALVGNTYYIPALVTTKTWDSGASRYYDTNEKIIVAANNLGFALSCPQPPLPKCIKKGQKNCLSVSIDSIAVSAAY